MSNEGLCPVCANSIRCEIWAEWKCKVKGKRIYNYKEIKTCQDYIARGKDFEEPKCQCDDCLNNELLLDEEEED